MKNIAFRWTILVGLLVIACLLDIMLGSVAIPIGQVIKILFGQSAEQSSWSTIILDFRLPRVITAIFVGAGLSVTGLLMQTFFRNPLAGPFVLGISSGASLGVAILVLAGSMIPWVVGLGIIGNVVAASIGAGFVFILILSIAQKVRDSATLLIVGLMFGSLTGALVGVLQYFSSAEQIQSYLIWTFGSLGSVTWSELPSLMIIAGLGLAFSMALFKPLNALVMGENYANSLGLDIRRVRNSILILSSIMAGAITAYVGPIAFIGIAVPHLTRSIFHTSDHKILLPATGLMGAIFLVTCDILSQAPGSDSILPINAITSLIGAPLVIWIIVRKRNLGHFFGA